MADEKPREPQDARGLVPTFTPDEGLYFHNVNAYMPLGQLNYQTVTFDRVAAGNGNFIMELTSIPDTTGVFGAHYSLPTFNATPYGGCGAANFTATTTPCNQYVQGYNRDKNSALAAYYDTHGYVEWGTAFPSWANVWPTICAGNLGVSSCSAAQLSSPAAKSVNFMDGSGVSTVRYAGSSTLAAGSSVKTYTLAAQAMVAGDENSGGGYWSQSANLCNGNECYRYTNGTAPAVNFTFTTTWNGSTATGAVATAQDAVNAGGFVFVSKSGSTWKVANNQNGSDVTGKIIELENDAAVKDARSYQSSTFNGGIGCLFCTRRVLSVSPATGANAVDYAAIQSRADTIFANDPNDNGRAMVTMNAINLGSSRVEGMLINHLKITSLGAN